MKLRGSLYIAEIFDYYLLSTFRARLAFASVRLKYSSYRVCARDVIKFLILFSKLVYIFLRNTKVSIRATICNFKLRMCSIGIVSNFRLKIPKSVKSLEYGNVESSGINNTLILCPFDGELCSHFQNDCFPL